MHILQPALCAPLNKQHVEQSLTEHTFQLKRAHKILFNLQIYEYVVRNNDR